MPQRAAAIGSATIVIGIVVVIIVAGIGVLVTAQSSHRPSSTGTSVSTIIVSEQGSAPEATTPSSATTATCNGGTLPTNSSSPPRVVLNVTQAFDSWNWTSPSTFALGSYQFSIIGSQNSQTKIYLEPQVFINVTNGQGQTQPTDMTDLGSFNGDIWPPDLSGGPNVLFGGNVTIQWLFPCSSHEVFFEVTTLSVTSSEMIGLQRSGPFSTYPAAWGIYSVCPGFKNTGNTTTLNNLSIVQYPNSWNTTTVVTLDQVYEDIISSSAFASLPSGQGWFVYSWAFIEGGSTNIPPNTDDVVGYFILTNATSPDGYITAYYNIQNGSVATSSITTTITVSCSTTTSSTTTSSSK